MRALAAAAACGVALVAGCHASTDGHGAAGNTLSHTSVEVRLEKLMKAEHVVCNHGRDMRLVLGREYWCNLGRGQYRFVPIVITNPQTHAYRIK